MDRRRIDDRARFASRRAVIKALSGVSVAGASGVLAMRFRDRAAGHGGAMTWLNDMQAAWPACATTPIDIVCIGDSITEGMVAASREEAWPQRLRDLLRAGCSSGSIQGGLGYCPVYAVGRHVNDLWMPTGAVGEAGFGSGLGSRCLKVPNGSSLQLSFTGTGIDLLTTTGATSALAYWIDDGAVTTVDQRHGSEVASGVIVPVRGLADGPHTVTVSGTPLGSAHVEGAMIYRGDENAGIRVWEAGHAGLTCADLNATSRWHGSFRAVPNPKVVVVCFGANEYALAITSAAYGRALDALLTTLRELLAGKACSFFVLSPHARMPLPEREDQAVFEAKAAEIAALHGAAHLSMTPVIGDCQTAIKAGLLQKKQGIHPTSAGHQRYADALAAALLATAGAADGPSLS